LYQPGRKNSASKQEVRKRPYKLRKSIVPSSFYIIIVTGIAVKYVYPISSFYGIEIQQGDADMIYDVLHYIRTAPFPSLGQKWKFYINIYTALFASAFDKSSAG